MDVKIKRNSETISATIHKYLERKLLSVEDPSWQISPSGLGGFGVFATRDIEVGDIVFKDSPVILGPRAGLAVPVQCVNCYRKGDLKLCEEKCGLKVCSSECQRSQRHESECIVIRKWQTKPIGEELSEKLFKVLAPIRSVLLSPEDRNVVKCLKFHKSDQHGFEVDVMKDFLQFNLREEEEFFMRRVCSVMDANAFEVLVNNDEEFSSVRGLYPLGGLANHCCTPNTMHVFDQNQNMVVRASVFIPKNTEIFHSYSRYIWCTPTRRYHLYRTKHFLCRCERCEDPTEFGSYMSAILCKFCKTGKVIPAKPLTERGIWKCEECAQVVDRKNIAAISSLLGSTLNSFSDDDVEFMLKFLNKKLVHLVPANNETVVEVKYKLIWALGYHENFAWSELSEDLILIKQKYCKELLSLLETLRFGQCKMRGLLLYELYCCYKETSRRQENSRMLLEVQDILLEATDILRYDVTAPNEIKSL